MSLRLALIGFGNVGMKLADMLARAHSCSAAEQLRAVVVAVTTRSRGALANSAGIDLARALSEIRRLGKFAPDNPEAASLNSLEAARSLDYDVLVELTPLNIQGEGEPAISHLRAALKRGRHVVTANKGPVAFAHRELSALAQSRQCAFLFEATVMDGAPVFSLARAGLKGCRILRIEGILNSTTNFVLSQLEAGRTLDSAIRVAQEAGFAEADPALDLEGWDGAAKICALANALMGKAITPFDVERESLLSLDENKLSAMLRRGKRLKYICRAWLEDERVRAVVRLEQVAHDHPFAAVSGTGSAVSIATDLMSPVSVAQQSPTLTDTAYGVIADLLTIRESWPRSQA